MFLMPAFMYVFNYSVKYVILFLFDSNRHITHWISVFRFSMRTFRSYLTEKNTRNNNFAFLTRPPRLAGSRKVRERGQDTPNDHFLQRFIFSPFPFLHRLSPTSWRAILRREGALCRLFSRTWTMEKQFTFPAIIPLRLLPPVVCALRPQLKVLSIWLPSLISGSKCLFFSGLLECYDA